MTVVTPGSRIFRRGPKPSVSNDARRSFAFWRKCAHPSVCSGTITASGNARAVLGLKRRAGQFFQLHMRQLIGPGRIEGRIGKDPKAVDLDQRGGTADQRDTKRIHVDLPALMRRRRGGTRHQINTERHWNDPHQIPDFDMLAKNNPGEQHAKRGHQKVIGAGGRGAAHLEQMKP